MNKNWKWFIGLAAMLYVASVGATLYIAMTSVTESDVRRIIVEEKHKGVDAGNGNNSPSGQPGPPPGGQPDIPNPVSPPRYASPARPRMHGGQRARHTSLLGDSC